MSRQESSFKLGKMSFHGNRRNCLGTQDFCSWIGSRPSKSCCYKNSLSTYNIQGHKKFLGHVGFYRRFIKDFSKISRPLCRLLEKDAKFDFDKSCRSAFDEIKSRLVTTPIMEIPDWNNDFEIMCDASDYVMGAVLGQRIEKIFKAIYYANKTFNEEQENYTIIEKEMLTMVFACEKFRPYILGSHVLIHIDHAAIKYLMA